EILHIPRADYYRDIAEEGMREIRNRYAVLADWFPDSCEIVFCGQIAEAQSAAQFARSKLSRLVGQIEIPANLVKSFEEEHGLKHRLLSA
ncbi:unnamed protein product, partial [Symbiodinium pilosum]